MQRAGVAREPFGNMPDGSAVELFILTNASGMEVRAATYGGAIVSLRVPGSAGGLEDVVLGHDTLGGYLGHSPYFGAIIGRYANRIARGRFTLGRRTYRLATNDGPHHLHGGARGFDKAVWRAEPLAGGGTGVVFAHLSPDGDEGYPGTLDARVTYELTDRSELIVDARATTDRPTPVNVTLHSYFNLAGAGAGDVLAHELTIPADSFLPVDATLIPTGRRVPVAGTPFDFRTPTAIGARIDHADEQLGRARGYDHTFVLNRPGPGLALAARLAEPVSGRVLEILTTEPGVQFYSGNLLDGSIAGKAGRVYGRRSGLCLEPQHFPDSPNQPGFPSTILEPGAEYRSRTVLRFSAR